MALERTFIVLFTAFPMMTQTAEKMIRLPAPVLKGGVTVEEALNRRRSIRDFAETPLSLREVGQLVWAAQGISYSPNRRTSPSAGATYPLVLYLVVNRAENLDPGVYRYHPEEHGLTSLKTGDVSDALVRACLNQRFVKSASVVLVIAAKSERTTRRYGERGVRYVHMECGHAGQNIYLQAEAMALGTVAVGAFEDARVQEVTGIPEPVLYLFPVGHKP